MPTINQLVRKPRKSKVSKSDSPALKERKKLTFLHHKNVEYVLVLGL